MNYLNNNMKQRSHENVTMNKLKKEVKELLKIISLIVMNSFKEKGIDVSNNRQFYSRVCARVFKRIFEEDPCLRRVKGEMNKVLLSLFSDLSNTSSEELKAFENKIDKETLSLMYRGVFALIIRYYVLEDISRLKYIIHKEITDVENELKSFQRIAPKVDEVDKDKYFSDKKANDDDDIILEDEAEEKVSKVSTSKNKETTEDSVLNEVRGILKKLYPLINNLLIQYHVSTDRIIGNIKLGEIAVVLGVRPEDIKIIIESYPYDSIPINKDSRMFKGDWEKTCEMLKSLLSNIDRKIKKVKEFVTL